MSWKCRNISLFCYSWSRPFFMLRHCSSGVVTLSYDILRDVASYVMAMSRHCSSALPFSTNVTAMLQH